MLNSRTGLFVATAKRSGSKSLHGRRHPLFRSYGANLPSSLTLVSLAHLRLLASPTCVGLGTGTLFSTFRRFSRQCSRSEFSRACAPNTLRLSDLRAADLPTAHPTGFDQHSTVGSPDSLRPSITPTRWYRNINLSSIDYAFRPRLRFRLTPGGRTFPGKPWVFGDQNSHLVFRYSCLHGHLYALHLRSHFGFNAHTTLFYHRDKSRSAASVPYFSPDHLRRDITRPVSYYALFK